MATRTAKSTPRRVTSPTGPEIEALAKADQAFHDVVHESAVGQISTSTAAGQDCLHVSGPTGIRLPIPAAPTPAVAPRTPRQFFEDEHWFRARLDAHFALEGKSEEWNGQFRRHARLEWMEQHWSELSPEERARAEAALREAEIEPARALRTKSRKRAGAAGCQETQEQRAARRRPILEKIGKTRGWLVTDSGVGKATVYGFFDGARKTILPGNRTAMADSVKAAADRLGIEVGAFPS